VLAQTFPGPIYPWHQWLDGRVHVLRRGEHYRSTGRAMCSNAHSTADRKGIRVDTRILLGGDLFALVAYAHPRPPAHHLGVLPRLIFLNEQGRETTVLEGSRVEAVTLLDGEVCILVAHGKQHAAEAAE
jgi:hypothetical protein